MNTWTLLHVGLRPAKNLSGKGSDVSLSEGQVSENEKERIPFSPSEVAVGGYPLKFADGQKNSGDRIRHGRARCSKDSMSVDHLAADFQGLPEVGSVRDRDFEKE